MKKKIFKSAISILLCTLMLVSTFGIGVVNSFAEGESTENLEELEGKIYTSGDYLYYIEGEYATIVGFANPMSGRVELPDEINGYVVYRFDMYTTDDEQRDAVISNSKDITEIRIPQHMTFFHKDVGYICLSDDLVEFQNLKSIEVDKNNEIYFAEDGVLFSKRIHDDGTYKTLEVYPPMKDGKSYVIENDVYEISDCAFYGCKNLENVTFGNNISIIGFWAFVNCKKISNITIPNSVKSIGNDAFSGCENLKNITFGNNITKIGWGAFDNTAYYNNPDNWENGYLYALNKKYLLDASRDISGDVKIDDNVCVISGGAFLGNANITEIKLPENIKSIPSNMCEGCTNLLKCDLPSSVEEINSSAFSNCEKLRNVKIGENVNSIGDQAFVNCMSISAYEVDSNNKTFFSDGGVLFERLENNKLCLVAYPLASSNKSYTIPASVVGIYSFAFYNCSNLKEINVDENNEYYCSFGGALYDKNWIDDDNFEYDLIQIPSNNNYKVERGTRFVYLSKPVSSNPDNPSVVHIPKTVSIIGLDFMLYNNTAPDYIFYEGTEDDWKDIEIYPEYKDWEKLNIPTKVIFNAYGDTLEEHKLNVEDHTIKIEGKNDEDTKGIYAEAQNTVFNEKVYLKVDGNFTKEEQSEFTPYITGTDSVKYNVALVNEENVPITNFDGTIKLYFPIPAFGDNYKIFHFAHDGSPEVFSTNPTGNQKQIKIENGYLVIEVDSFSPFVVTWEGESKGNKMEIIGSDTMQYKNEQTLKINSTLAVEYKSDNEKVASVDPETGKVTAVGSGTATITATIKGTDISATKTITVKYAWWQWIVRILLLGFIWY